MSNNNNNPTNPTIASIPPTFEAQNRRSRSNQPRRPAAPIIQPPIQQQQVPPPQFAAQFTAADWDDDLGQPPFGMTEPGAIAMWRERERRQRTIRVFMMFLLMLLLMEEEPNSSSVRHPNHRLRGGAGKHIKRSRYPIALEADVYASRVLQDEQLRTLGQSHPRYWELIRKEQAEHKNNGSKLPDYNEDTLQWVLSALDMEKDEFDNNKAQQDVRTVTAVTSNSADPEEDRKVFHYPWNSTGFYRGEWKRQISGKSSGLDDLSLSAVATSSSTRNVEGSSNKLYSTNTQQLRKTANEAASVYPNATVENITVFNATDLEETMLEVLHDEKQELFGVHLLPPGYALETRDDNNLTFLHWEDLLVDPSGNVHHRNSNVKERKPPFIASGNAGESTIAKNPSAKPPVTLTRDSGRAAFQLFSRSIPAMKELSLVDGFVKLYDSTSPGYSTSKDILLRVRGVLIHSIGRLSLTAGVPISQAAFVMTPPDTNLNNIPLKKRIIENLPDGKDDNNESDATLKAKARRRLEEALENPDTVVVEEVREDALKAFGDDVKNSDKYDWSLTTPDFHDSNEQSITNEQRRLEKILEIASSHIDEKSRESVATELINEQEGTNLGADTSNENNNFGEEGALEGNATAQTTSQASLPLPRRKGKIPFGKVHATRKPQTKQLEYRNSTDTNRSNNSTKIYLPAWSNVVMPYPFVRDDSSESIRKARTAAARMMPPREQNLEANAAHCSFEINMDVDAVEWSVGAWRKLVTRHVQQRIFLDPERVEEEEQDDKEKVKEATTSRQAANGGRRRQAQTFSSSSSGRVSKKTIEDQALVMSMLGEIRSTDCDFAALLNVTAMRTDWEAATSKAINYSFYMMLVCLTQILILLRQLLHSQSNSTATRVSILCIGWQTVIDALLCLAHIYLSLAFQPLFTAFASVAFFKLLIFCVIEMKYMAIITQARNSSNGGQPTDVLRRQVAVLHLRFYVALMVVFLMVLSFSEKYRLPLILALYSFWVPQIVLNVITEAKAPMHRYYIYGMSISRLVVPLYMLALPGNFLKQVVPDAPSDIFTCQMLVLWIGAQAAVLMAQSKYGSRFMIPARFLPPKFDYSRPIPASMLPPGASTSILLYEQPQATSTVALMEDRDDALGSRSGKNSSEAVPLLVSDEPESSAARRERHTTDLTTRNRKRGNRGNRTSSSMTTENHTISASSASPTVDVSHNSNSTLNAASPPQCCLLDCSICYDGIDIRKRKEYMLAPCNHLFHRDCLSQWMDVKMECPICRTELPAL